MPVRVMLSDNHVKVGADHALMIMALVSAYGALGK